jgi:DNA-binding CsgD family transcriptional regulator
VLVHLATVTVHVGDHGEAIPLLREALREAEGDAAIQAAVHLGLADLTWRTTNREDGLAHAQIAVGAARSCGDASLLCRALSAYALLSFSLGRGSAVAELDEALVLERSLPGYPLRDAATWVLAHQSVLAGDLDGARRCLDIWRAGLNARDDAAEAEALRYLSLVEWRAGNWSAAARHAIACAHLEAEFGHAARPADDLLGTVIAAHRGEVADARTRALRGLVIAEAAGDRFAQSGYLWVLGFLDLADGDAAAALEHLLPAYEIRDDVRALEPGERFELGDTLEALITEGRLDEAERLLSMWEERSRVLDRGWSLAILARCRALVLVIRGDWDGSWECFESAMREHARAGDPFQCARTLLALGATQRRAKQRGAARKTLSRAHEMFSDLGAPLWAGKARDELARVGGRPPSTGDLTEGERRIVALVAEGRRNREVAAALFLTEHTVETVLSRAYRKLGVHSRSELAPRLGRLATAPPIANS